MELEKVFNNLAMDMADAALDFKKEFPDVGGASIAVGQELIYLSMHILDQQLASEIEEENRSFIFDTVIKKIMVCWLGYHYHPSRSDYDPKNEEAWRTQMVTDLNSRQKLYGQCTSLLGDDEELPCRPGQMVYVLNYYIQRAVKGTPLPDVENMLIGKEEPNKTLIEDFDLVDALKNAVTVHSLILQQKIPDRVEQFKQAFSGAKLDSTDEPVTSGFEHNKRFDESDDPIPPSPDSKKPNYFGYRLAALIIIGAIIALGYYVLEEEKALPIKRPTIPPTADPAQKNLKLDVFGNSDPSVEEFMGYLTSQGSYGSRLAEVVKAKKRTGPLTAEHLLEALQWITREAENGDAESQVSIGFLYDIGLGLPESENVLKRRLRSLATSLGPYGVVNEVLAGIDDPYKREAVKWYRMAADQGHWGAQLNMGIIYREGEGLGNYRTAIKWFRKAADGSGGRAEYNLGLMALNGEGSRSNSAKAADLFKKSALKGYILGQYQLAQMLLNGSGVRVNEKEALIWYRSAGEQGHPEAQYMVGRMHMFGMDTPKNIGLALQWYKKAADSGYGPALSVLGTIYREGKIVKQNFEIAVSYLKLAAIDSTNPASSGPSRALLGFMYLNGEGTAADVVEAYAWFLLAQESGYEPAEEAVISLRNALTKAQIEKALSRSEELNRYGD